jgi:hypothetical protein
MSFRDLGTGVRGCFILAALVCALLCPPLVLVFLCTLTLTVAAAIGSPLQAPAVASARRAYIHRPALRGPPAR